MSEISGTLCTFRGPTETLYLVLRRPQGGWDLPKGHVRPKETMKAAALRETHEETSLWPSLTGRVEKVRHDGDIIQIFEGECSSKRVKLSDEHTDYAWVSAKKAASILFPPLAKIVGMLTRVTEDLLSRTSILESEDPHAHLKWADGPKPPSGPSDRYYAWSALNKAHRAAYYEGKKKKMKGGEEISSRTTKSEHPLDIPLGSWKIDDGHKGSHGRSIGELQAHHPRDITPKEFDWENPEARLRVGGRHWDAERYADWLEKDHNEREARGEQHTHARVPPIDVTKLDNERLRASGDGHRRLAAVDMLNQRRKKQGKPPLKIPAWTSWSADHPKGAWDTSRDAVQKTHLTHEIAQTGKINRSFKPRDNPVTEERAERCGSVAASLLKPGTKRWKEHFAKAARKRKLTMKRKLNASVDPNDFSLRRTIGLENTMTINMSLCEREEQSEKLFFWSENHSPQDYQGCIEGVDNDVLTAVIGALKEGKTHQQYKGWANCRICDAHLGSKDLYHEGFIFPSMAEHYIEEHGVWTPGLDAFAHAVLAEDHTEDHTDERADKKHCGVFLPIPFNLAKDFPNKRAEDDSVPHFTVLYMGDMSPDAYARLCKTVSKIAERVKPFELDLAHYGEFSNDKGQKIAHMCPGITSRMRLAALHALLHRTCELHGLKPKHNYGPMDSPKIPAAVKYKPHATLAYLPPMSLYKGPKPMGSWKVTELECWGYDKVRVPLGMTRATQPIGLTRDPIMMRYPSAVPDVVPSRTPMKGKKAVKAEDKLPGGLADKSSPREFNSKELAKGVKVELEHTGDRDLAQEIAMDHLKEDPRYYTKLAKVHEESTSSGNIAAPDMKKWGEAFFREPLSVRKLSGDPYLEKVHGEDVTGGSMGAVGKGVGGSHGDIGLDGSLPVLKIKQDADKKLQRKSLAGLK